MTFLKQVNKNKRLEIQFQAFLETMHLELVSKALDISSFILPKAEYEFLLLNILIKL